MILLEYIWLDSINNFRSKIRVLDTKIDTLEDIPKWNYDGSSTGQSKSKITEIILNPVFYCKNPFHPNIESLIVLCNTYDLTMKPLDNNYRDKVEEIFRDNKDMEPWYGFEQEYFIINPKTNLPIGYNEKEKQGKYYCSIGYDRAFGRNISDGHLNSCLYAGLTISGTNAEVAPGQWEYQIGPVEGIYAGDQLLVSRYILVKLAESYNCLISFEPKPLKGDWNGSGCHTNFSTNLMRGKNGIEHIYKCIEKLGKTYELVNDIYGKDNNQRLTGTHETSKIDEFSYGIATRNTSIRIGSETYTNKCGYFEDRRPSSNCDPYLVSSYLLENCLD